MNDSLTNIQLDNSSIFENKNEFGQPPNVLLEKSVSRFSLGDSKFPLDNSVVESPRTVEMHQN